MAADVDKDDDEGNDASSTTCYNKGDNRNCNEGKDACALTATTSAHRHRQRQRHSQS